MLRNIHNGIDVQPPSSSPRYTSETIDGTVHLVDGVPHAPVAASTLPLSLAEADPTGIASTTASSASEALLMAIQLRSQSNQEAISIARRDRTPESSLQRLQMTDEVISDITSLAESTDLYAKNSDPTQNLEQLLQISQKTTPLGLALQTSDASVEASTTQCLLSAQIRAHSIRKTSQSESSRLSGAECSSPSISLSNRSSSSRLPQSNLQDDVEDFQCIERQVKARVSLSNCPRASMKCSFELEAFEQSVVLRVLALCQSYTSSDKAILSKTHSRTSASLSSGSPSMSQVERNSSSLIFEHHLQAHARPIPHVLHPVVEGLEGEPDEPYAITFKERQCIFEGAAEAPRWTASIKYILDRKEDQTTLCQTIFGKRLVAMAGSNKIVYDGREVSHMSAVILWYDRGLKRYSITFCPNVTGKKSEPEDMELGIYGILEAPSSRPKLLSVAVDLIPRVHEDLDSFANIERHQTARSGTSFLRRAFTSNSPKQKKSGNVVCTIKFTDEKDRAVFVHEYKTRSSQPADMSKKPLRIASEVVAS